MRKIKDIKSPDLKLEFTDPDTGYHFNVIYANFNGLLNHIKAYRRANKLPEIPNLEYLVNLYLANIPENISLTEEVEKDEPIKMGLSHYVKGAKAFIGVTKQKILNQRSEVGSETLLKRQACCAFCKHNTEGIKDYNIAEQISRKIGNNVIKEVEGDKTAYSDFMGQCTKCGCPLKTKTKVLANIVMQSLSDIEHYMLPKGTEKNVMGETFTCWQRIEELKKEPEYNLDNGFNRR